MIKFIIVVLLLGVVISLMSGLVFLFKDTNRSDSKRTLYALGIRIGLATALVLTIFYGLYTGELRLGTNAPWHSADRHETGFKRPGGAAPSRVSPDAIPTGPEPGEEKQESASSPEQ